MTADVALWLIAILCVLVIVARPVLARQRRGEAIARYAAIWAAIIGAAFVVAYAVGGRR